MHKHGACFRYSTFNFSGQPAELPQTHRFAGQPASSRTIQHFLSSSFTMSWYCPFRSQIQCAASTALFVVADQEIRSSTALSAFLSAMNAASCDAKRGKSSYESTLTRQELPLGSPGLSKGTPSWQQPSEERNQPRRDRIRRISAFANAIFAFAKFNNLQN